MNDNIKTSDSDLKPSYGKSVFKKNSVKFLEILAVVVICAVVLVVFLSDFDLFSKQETTAAEVETFGEYINNLETKLANTISNIEGVGKATVAITFESGIEKTYAYETISETSNGLTTEELILYKGEPVVLKEIMPVIKGVVVVAKGASNAVVRLNIIRTVQILLGVTYDKIEVFTFKT